MAQGLDNFREKVADPAVKLSDRRAAEAAQYLEVTAYAILSSLLCAGLQPSPGAAVGHVVETIQVTCCRSSEQHRRIRCQSFASKSSQSDPLGMLLPVELLPVVPVAAPPPTGTVPLGQAIHHYLGFRAALIRSQRSRALAISRNSEGQVPIRSFSYRGDDFDGILAQRKFFESKRQDIRIALDWPDAAEESPAYASLAERLLSGTEIIHFACHYNALGPGSPPEPLLDFGESRTRSAPVGSSGRVGAPVEAFAPTTAGDRPLIFLNACQTTGARLRGDTLFGLLVEHRYRRHRRQRDAAARRPCGKVRRLPLHVAAKNNCYLESDAPGTSRHGGQLQQSRRHPLYLLRQPRPPLRPSAATASRADWRDYFVPGKSPGGASFFEEPALWKADLQLGQVLSKDGPSFDPTHR